jgi:hypothetical protein
MRRGHDDELDEIEQEIDQLLELDEIELDARTLAERVEDHWRNVGKHWAKAARGYLIPVKPRPTSPPKLTLIRGSK